MFSILFISIISVCSFALDLEKDVLEKSQNLILQKDRLKAVTLINNVIDNNNLSMLQKAQAKEALGIYSRMFLQEKTQSVFEHGLSLINTDLEKSLQKIQEAKQLEPLNLSIGIYHSKALLLKKQCQEAYSSLDAYYKIYNKDMELIKWMEISLLCRADSKSLLEFIQQNEALKHRSVKYSIVEKDEPIDLNWEFNLGWVFFILEKKAENLSRKQYKTLLNFYRQRCPENLKPMDDNTEAWLFCGKQEEYKSFFAKKFKIEEKN